MANQKPGVVRRRIELIVPHEERELVSIYPPQGPHNYQTVGRGILARKLDIPTGDQTASLVHGAYNSQEPEFREIQDIMRKNWLWVFNRNLWTPEGVYVVQDPEAIGLSEPLDVDTLEKILSNGTETLRSVRFSKDRTTRFAPKGSYRFGEHTKESLAIDGFVIASYDEEGAKKLAEISTEFRYSPLVYGLDIKKGQGHKQRVSALDSVWGLGVRRLGVYGDYIGDGRFGCAFGVQKTGGASRAEK